MDVISNPTALQNSMAMVNQAVSSVAPSQASAIGPTVVPPRSTMMSAWGFGKDGRLGTLTEKDNLLPTPISSVSGHYIIEVACGAQFTLALTDRGRVFVWGSGKCGECGTGKREVVMKPKEIKFPEGFVVRHIYAGYYQAAAISTNNTLLVWGKNESASLGTGKIEELLVPTPIKTISGVTAVGCGAYHSVVATNSHRIYTVGATWDGRLGHGEDTGECLIYKPIRGLSLDVIKICCGWDHTLVLTRDGKIYSWGKGTFGQLGHGNFNKSYSPTLIDILSDKVVVDIAAGGTFSAAVTDDGDLYTWGDDKSRQLGHPVPKHRLFKQHKKVEEQSFPRKVKFFEEYKIAIQRVAAGAQHMLALSDIGELYMWGHCAGRNSKSDEKGPQLLECDKSIVSIHSGLSHCVIAHEPRQIEIEGTEKSKPYVMSDISMTPSRPSIHIEWDLGIAHGIDLLFKMAFQSVMKGLKKANLLLVGQTGVGKSSLVNAIFEQDISQVGRGVPITKHITKYEKSDLPVTLYDTVGIIFDPAKESEITKQIKEILFHPASQDDIIHVVWYVIDAAQSRFTPFEANMFLLLTTLIYHGLCKTVLQKVPLAFILNKADLVDEEALRDLKKAIVRQNFSNCLGIFKTFVKDGKAIDELEIDITVCPYCKGDGIIVSRKYHTYTCEDCSATGRLPTFSNEMKKLVEASFVALPNYVQQSFVTGQQILSTYKEQSSVDIIREMFMMETSKKTINVSPVFETAQIVARLTLLWASNQHKDLFNLGERSDQLVSPTWLNMLEKSLKLLEYHKGDEHTATAIVVLWNFCLKRFSEGTNKDMKDPVEYAFKHFNPSTLSHISHVLEEQGLEAIINTMADDIEFSESNQVRSSSPRDQPISQKAIATSSNHELIPLAKEVSRRAHSEKEKSYDSCKGKDFDEYREKKRRLLKQILILSASESSDATASGDVSLPDPPNIRFNGDLEEANDCSATRSRLTLQEPPFASTLDLGKPTSLSASSPTLEHVLPPHSKEEAPMKRKEKQARERKRPKDSNETKKRKQKHKTPEKEIARLTPEETTNKKTPMEELEKAQKRTKR